MSGWFVAPEPIVHMRCDAQGRSYTPDLCALAVVQRLARMVTPDSVWEPCVGGGAFVRAARAVWPGVVTIGTDIDPDAAGRALCDVFAVQDAKLDSSRYPPTSDEIRVTVTNPPFGKAVGQDVTVAIIANARRDAAVCAMVVPLDYLAQAGLEEHVKECALVAPLLPRPFPHERGMVLLVWDSRHEGQTIHDQLRWKGRTQ